LEALIGTGEQLAEKSVFDVQPLEGRGILKLTASLKRCP